MIYFKAGQFDVVRMRGGSEGRVRQIEMLVGRQPGAREYHKHLELCIRPGT